MQTQSTTESKNTHVGACSFYAKMPDFNKPLLIMHMYTGETKKAIRNELGLWVDGHRVDGCYYLWVYNNHP